MATEGSESGVPKKMQEQLEKAADVLAGNKEAPEKTKIKKGEITKDEAERLIKKLESL